MNTILKDLVHHNIWATRKLFDACKALSGEQQQWTASGVFGDIRSTLEHLVDSEIAYFRLLTGIEVDPPDGQYVDLSIHQSREWITMLDSHWDEFLTTDTNVDHLFTARSDSGERFQFTHGVALAQVFNHANVHREQVCNILTVHGVEPPEIDPWTYAIATGRGGPVSEEIS